MIVQSGSRRLENFPTRSSLALLIYLAENRRKVHVREVLAERLFPGLPPESSRQNLRQALYSLRQQIPEVPGAAGAAVPLVESSRETLRIHPEADLRLDTAAFERAAAEESYEEAAGLYRGVFLEDFFLPDNVYFEDWIQSRRHHYRRRLMDSLERLVTSSLARNNLGSARRYGERLVAEDPLREISVRILMQVYIRSGERVQALRLFEQLHEGLEEELEVVPAPETQALYEEIVHGQFPTLQAPVARSTEQSIRLPAMPTAFFGRSNEINKIRRLIQNPAARLITLLGPGGVGKTRLSIQAAAAIGAAYRDGAAFVALQSVGSTDEMVLAAIKSLDVPIYPGEDSHRMVLLNFLSGKNLLLLLDNFEQLVSAGGASLVAEMLRAAPELTVLVSSRVRLNIQGENLYPVGGLDVPSPEAAADCESPRDLAAAYSAIQLFVDRAALVHPDFSLNDENSRHVIEICRLVNGLPLGIELAATWVELLSPEAIITEIRNSLDFLESDLQDLPERQRSIRAVFESSWRMLTNEERDVMLRLSVFTGPFSREAAQQVSGASLRILMGLLNKSWLQHREDGYFGIHTLLQHYVRELLGAEPEREQEALERRGTYYAEFMEHQFSILCSPDQRLALDAIEAEFDNVRTVFRRFAAEGQKDVLAWRILPALYRFAFIRDYLDELIALCSSGVSGDLDPAAFPDPDELVLHIVAAWARGQFTDWDVVQRKDDTVIWYLVEKNSLADELGPWYINLMHMHYIPGQAEAIEMMEAEMPRLKETMSPWWYGNAAWGLAVMLRNRGGIEWRHWVETALERFEQHGGPFEQAMALRMLSDHEAYNHGDLAAAQRYLDQAVAKSAVVEAAFLDQACRATQANLYRLQGKYAEAFAIDRERTLEFLRSGARRWAHEVIIFESLHHARYGSLEEAAALRRQALEMNDPAQYPAEFAWSLWELGDLYRLTGDPEKARDHYERAKVFFQQYDILLGIGYYSRGLGLLAMANDEFDRAREHFEQLLEYTPEHLWSEAYGQGYLGRALAHLRRYSEAEKVLQKGIDVAESIGHRDLALIALLGYAEIAAGKGSWEIALTLTAGIVSDFNTWHEIRKEAGILKETASENLDPEAVDRAVERGKTRSFEELVVLATG